MKPPGMVAGENAVAIKAGEDLQLTRSRTKTPPVLFSRPLSRGPSSKPTSASAGANTGMGSSMLLDDEGAEFGGIMGTEVVMKMNPVDLARASLMSEDMMRNTRSPCSSKP